MSDLRLRSADRRTGQYDQTVEQTMTRTNVLNTATVNFLELIGNGKTYRVPPYQRDYAWTEEAWEDFWNDVLDLRRQPDGRHYMGALVVQGRTDREFTIIDGQQRLATLGTLSLAVIHKLHRMAVDGIDEERNLERAKVLRNRFVGEKDPASLIESSRLNLSRTDDAFYQNCLVQLRTPLNPRGLPRSNALLWECFQYFSERLDALDDIQEDGESLARILSETTARGLLFILITVEDEFDAYTVFETLNARGLELTTADLLKNYLFSKVRVQGDLDALRRRWQTLIATSTQERFSEFLRHHLLCEQAGIRKERLLKVAVTLGVAASYVSNRDAVHRILRRLGVTRETSCPSVWYSAFSRHHGCYVVLHLQGQRRLFGWPEELPSRPNEGHIRIAEAEWLVEDERRAATGVSAIPIPAEEVESAFPEA